MNTLLNYPGAKWGMAKKIISLMPPHRSYLEPYFGSGAVLFNKPPSAIETVNDIDGDIVNFFTMLREQPDMEGVCKFEEREGTVCRNPATDNNVGGKWIPVTERLPEPEKRVLLLTTYSGWNGKKCRDIMCGFYEDGNVWCEDSKVAWDWEMKREENYDESRDDYRVPEGWFEELLNHIDDYNCVIVDEPVTHWMPLPEPPKEEDQ